MKDIIKLIKYTDISYMKRQIGCMIFLLLNTVLTLVYPSCISVIVDQGVAKGSIEDIIKYSILMFVLGILIMITNYVQQIKYAKLGREICEILRNRMFEKLCKTNYKFWCENRVGDIITILDTDVSLVEKILTSIISCGILNILYFSGIIMVLLLCNVKTGFLITILVFLFVLLQKKNGKKVKRGMSELREKIGWFNSETQEMIHNMPDIQLIYPEKDLVNSYMQQNRLTNMSYIQQTKNMLEAKNIGWGFNILSIFSVLLIGGYAVLREDISVGILFSMIVYVQQLYSPAVALGETYNSIKNAQPSILRISTLLENKEMVEEADFCPEGSLKGNIIFKNVTFSYAQNTDPVFRNLNLSLKAGRIYGITGDNGMGKSTFTATNLDLVDNFKALNDMKFRSIPMAPAQNLLSDEDYDRLIGENTKLVQYFLELIQSGDYKTAKKLRILMSGLQKIHKSGVARKILCGVGSAQLAVDINGEIYPCHRFVANKEYAMGNVLKDTKIEKMPFLEEITLEKHKECKNCWARNLCVGACPNENLVNAGTTQKSDSKNCRFIQAMYNDLIHAYLELTVENKKQLLG